MQQLDDGEIAYEFLLQQWLTRSHDEYDTLKFLTDRVARNETTTLDALRWRTSVLHEETDLGFCIPLLEGGIRPGKSDGESCALLLLARDMQSHERDVLLKRTIDRYKKSDPVFTSQPWLFDELDKKREMVSLQNLNQWDRSGVFTSDSGTEVKLISGLDPEIVNYALSNSVKDIWVRLDPDYPTSPLFPIASYSEPLKSEWANFLGKTSFSKLIKPMSITILPNDARTRFEYYGQGLRKFEILGTPRKDGSYQVFIEELMDSSSLRIGGNGIEIENPKADMIGRMIHFDTYASLEKKCDEVELCHLDCAITVYKGDLRERRLCSAFNEEAATKRRIHLFKAAPIPLRLFPGLAFLFFKRSQRPLSTWLSGLVSE